MGVSNDHPIQKDKLSKGLIIYQRNKALVIVLPGHVFVRAIYCPLQREHNTFDYIRALGKEKHMKRSNFFSSNVHHIFAEKRLEPSSSDKSGARSPVRSTCAPSCGNMV